MTPNQKFEKIGITSDTSEGTWIHVSWSNLVKIGRWKVDEKSSGIADKNARRGTIVLMKGVTALCTCTNVIRISWGLPELFPKDWLFWPPKTLRYKLKDHNADFHPPIMISLRCVHLYTAGAPNHCATQEVWELPGGLGVQPPLNVSNPRRCACLFVAGVRCNPRRSQKCQKY